MSNPFTTKDPLVDIIKQVVLGEKKLTDAELKKREEIVLAIKRENPDMEKSRAYAIATAQAKEVAEEVEAIDESVFDSKDAAQSVVNKLKTKHDDGNYHVKADNGKHRVVHAYYPNSTVKKQIARLDEEVELDEAMKPFTAADHATADKHGTKIEKNLENIKKVPTKHLQYLHHHNMGYASSGGYLHHALPHIETELKKRGKKPLSDEDGEKVFNESVDQIDEISKKTLGNYIGKAVVDVHNDARFAGESGSKDASKRAFKRLLGVKSAAARLSKQNVSGGRISNYRSKTAMFDEQLENFWEAYTTMFNEAEDQQQNILLRAMAKDPSDLMKMKRAIKMGDKALTNPALRQEILAMLDKMMHLTTADPSLLQRTKMGFQKAKKLPEEVEINEAAPHGMSDKEYARHELGKAKKPEVKVGAKVSVTGGGSGVVQKIYDKELHNGQKRKFIHLKDNQGRDFHHRYYAHRVKVMEDVELGEAIGAKDKQDEGEYGYEGDMAMSQLRTIIRNCQEMMKVLDKETDMPEWVQSKITLATDYLQTANDYLMSELEEAANPAQQAAIAIAMKKAGKKPKTEEVELGEADEKEVGKEVKAARLKKDSSEFMSKSSLFSGGAHDVAKHLGKKDDEKYGEAMKKVKDTPVSKFVASRKGDGNVHTEEAEKAPFEGGREVKSSKPAAERVKKIAKGMQKHYTKDKK